jgi:hypothetical protein
MSIESSLYKKLERAMVKDMTIYMEQIDKQSKK